jgi:uncharacterized protein with HEPN domain
MSEVDSNSLIEDILECIGKIEKYTAGLNFKDFSNDEKTIDAVVRNFEIIGEAANKIDESIKNDNNDIEWRKMIGLRNRVIHDYLGVDLEIIWYIITYELQNLKEKLKDLI